MEVIRSAAFVLLVTVGSAASCATDTPERVPIGNWGGEHIGMVVTDTGATIEYDCATGKITELMALGSDGSFTWSGTHSPGHGGPSRENEPPDDRPARYSGRATTTTMRVTLTVLDGSVPPQTFTLARGGVANVFKCL
jgi:hypothetical protein